MEATSVGSVLLYNLSNDPDTVCWSVDERVAVTTNENIYILTLKGPGGNEEKSVEPSSLKKRPLFVMSQTQPPNKDHLDLGGAERSPPLEFPPSGSWDMMALLDPVLVGSCDSFKRSDWTPVGCSALKGCMLTSMTLSGRLLLYSPPATTSNRWRLAADLTSLYCDILKSCDFDHAQLQQHQSSEPPSHSQPLNEQAMQHSPSHSDTGSVSVTSRASNNAEFIKRRLSVACTAFHWFPSLLESGVAMVAMATRSGHVILLGMHVPFVCSSKQKEREKIVVLSVTELPSMQQGSWPCKLKWQCNSSGASLAVGCTDGQVFCLQWQDKSTVQLLAKTPTLSVVWRGADDLPVYNMVWRRNKSFSPTQLNWLVFSKGSALVALCLSSHTPVTPIHQVIISGYHVLPVVGLCALPNGSFLSTARDGTIQTFTVSDQSHDGHVTSTPVAMEMASSEGGVVSVQGVAVSHNGIFGLLATNLRQDNVRYKKKYLSQLNFISLSSLTDVEAVIKEQGVCHWDVCEYLQQVYLQQKQLPKSVEKFITLKMKSPSLSRLQLALQLHIISEKDPAAIQKCREKILHCHIVSSLRHWLGWRERGGGSEQQADNLGSLCLHLMCQWLTSQGNPPSSDVTLVKKVCASLPANPPGEVCVACGVSIPVSNCQRETCQNGHIWNRCSLTLILATDFQSQSCMQCNTTRAHLTCSEGTWLAHFLMEHTCCIYCGGYFEQVT